MKELSIEQKAKRYDKALDEAKAIHKSIKKDLRPVIEQIFPELQESDDAKMWKLLKKYVHYNISDTVLEADHITREYLESWLEKQGEQKTSWSEEDENSFLNVLWCCKKAASIAKDENEMGTVWCAEQWLKSLKERVQPKQGEQNSVDKVEPKFKVGNWYQCTKNFLGKGVTFDRNTAYYCAIEGCLQDEYGCHIAIVKDLYDNFKLWTIEDAKDGDVLVGDWYQGDDYWEKIIIFKKYHNKGIEGLIHAPCVEGYGNTFKNGKMAFVGEVPDYSKTWTDNLHPATKEQREQLEKAMSKAGYKWNKEERKPEKI